MSTANRTAEQTIPDPLAAFPDFMNAIKGRLQAGAREYGKASFSRPTGELAGEVEQELLDVCGWSFILWLRVRNLKEFDAGHNTIESGGSQ